MKDKNRTPPKLFKILDNTCLGPFFWDAYSNVHTCLVPHQKEFNEWDGYNYLHRTFSNEHVGSIFLNPPNVGIGKFIKKAWYDSRQYRVVILIRADMSTNWFNWPTDKFGIEPVHYIQRANESFRQAASKLDAVMEYSPFGVLHFRRRMRLYVSPRIMYVDAIRYPDDVIEDKETRNYIRVSDGIVSKTSNPNPVALIVFKWNRRAKPE